MKKIEFSARGVCSLCGSKVNDVHIPFRDIPVLRCNDCGFMWSGRVMTAEVMDTYYREDFGSDRHFRGQIVNSRINVWALRRLIDLRNTKTLLDVGTGYGFLLKYLRDIYDIGVTGIELSKKEAEYGTGVLSLDIRNSDLAESGFEGRTFDVVSCFEVIEHIAQPKQFLKEMVQFVKPGGHLVIMTDNFESAVANKLGAFFPKWIPHSHISHFGPNTLRGLVTTAGMHISGYFSYTPWELLLKEYAYSFKKKRETVDDAFNLADVLKTEMNGTFKLYRMRKFFNPIWAYLTARENLSGALMYLSCRRLS